MLAVAASAAAMVARRFKRHPELLGRLIAKKAVGPALKRVS